MAGINVNRYAISPEKLRLRDWVARTKVKELWTGYRIDCGIVEENEELKDFFDNLEKNDLMKIFKNSERYNSIYGDSLNFFDIEGEDLKLGTYLPNVLNQTLKIDGIDEYASIGVRQVTATNGGWVVSVKECRTKNELQRVAYGGISGQAEVIPVDVFMIKTPEIIKERAKVGNFPLNYNNVLSAKQFLNKDIVDFENEAYMLPDTYNGQQYEDLIIEMVSYIEDEKEANRTRVFGMFSNQDTIEQGKVKNIQKNLNLLVSAGVLDPTTEEYYNEMFVNPKELLKNNFFVQTQGGNNRVDVQEGNFDLERQTKGLIEMIGLYFSAAGLDSPLVKTGGAVKSVSEIKMMVRNSFETIKEANILRTAQIEEFIERMMIAKGIDPLKNKGKWKFNILSGILDEEKESIDAIEKQIEKELLSRKTAIGNINKEWNEDRVEEELKLIIEEKKVFNDKIEEDNNEKGDNDERARN